jgi:hypothetical protein
MHISSILKQNLGGSLVTSHGIVIPVVLWIVESKIWELI